MDEIKSLILNNIESYDINLLFNLINDLKENLSLCVKFDYELLNFFANKKNFRTIADLKRFSQEKIEHKVKKAKRADIEEEIAKISTSKNLNIEKLRIFLGKTEISRERKKKTTAKTRTKIIEDQTSRWINITSQQLKNELEDLKIYPDASTLKQAADSILEINEKRLRKREKIISIIVKRIAEDRAIARLGR